MPLDAPVVHLWEVINTKLVMRFLCLSITFILTLSLSHTLSFSQICDSGYMPFNEGVSFELTSYNKKDKVTSRIVHEITEVKQVSGGWKADIATEFYDNKDKSVFDGEYSVECTDDGLEMDMSSMMNPQMMASFSSLEMEVTGDALMIPHSLEPGQTLPDGSMQVKASAGGMAIMNMTLHITDRKVTGTETVITPAGTFDCVKISQTTRLEGFGNNEYTSTTWYAKETGMVRSENYDKKGEMDSYSELTSIKR